MKLCVDISKIKRERESCQDSHFVTREIRMVFYVVPIQRISAPNTHTCLRRTTVGGLTHEPSECILHVCIYIVTKRIRQLLCEKT